MASFAAQRKKEAAQKRLACSKQNVGIQLAQSCLMYVDDLWWCQVNLRLRVMTNTPSADRQKQTATKQ
jgi:hypothetical protein